MEIWRCERVAGGVIPPITSETAQNLPRQPPALRLVYPAIGNGESGCALDGVGRLHRSLILKEKIVAAPGGKGMLGGSLHEHKTE